MLSAEIIREQRDAEVEKNLLYDGFYFYHCLLFSVCSGGLHLKPPKFEHIYAHAISAIPPLLTTITQEGRFTLKKKKTPRGITATCFSNPQTNLGARRSRRLGIITATN